MTTASDERAEKEAKKQEAKAKQEEIDAREKEANKDRSGVGTRVSFFYTRGRSNMLLSAEQWDETQPLTLPKSVEEFLSYHATQDGKALEDSEILKRLILGDNEINYKEASDPVAEFIDFSWPEDVQKSFKVTVKNYASMNEISIEEAVALIKPGTVKAHEKRLAAAKS